MYLLKFLPNRGHLKLASMVIGMLLTVVPGVLAQSTNGIPKSGPAHQAHVVGAAAGGLTVSTNISYRLPAAKNFGLNLQGAPATGTPVPSGWAQRISTDINRDDSPEHESYVKWVEAH